LPHEIAVRPSKVDGEIARLVEDEERMWVEVWTADGWRRPEGSYPDVAAVLKAPYASQDDLIRGGVVEAVPGELKPPYPRVVVQPVMIDEQIFRLGSNGNICFVEGWEPDAREWRKLRRHEPPSCARVVNAPPAESEDLRRAGLVESL
jgi:hypothetical protein